MGKRSILQFSYEEKFEDVFNLGGKKFDSNQLAYFGTQKEWFFNTGVRLKYRVSGRLALSMGGSYFIPISNTTGLTVVEKNEFWPWNRKKSFKKGQINSDAKEIFDSNFLFQLGLDFKFYTAYLPLKSNNTINRLWCGIFGLYCGPLAIAYAHF